MNRALRDRAAGELAVQLELMQQHARELLARAATPAGQRLTFRPDPAVSAELDALVAAERDCCSFLTLTVLRSNEQLVLDGAAPAEARPILDALLEAKPARTPDPGPGRGRRGVVGVVSRRRRRRPGR